MKMNWINTTLLTVIIAMLAWFFNKGFEKMDSLNSTTIRLEVRVSGMEGKLTDVPSRTDLMNELAKRDTLIKALNDTVQQLRRSSVGVKP